MTINVAHVPACSFYGWLLTNQKRNDDVDQFARVAVMA